MHILVLLDTADDLEEVPGVRIAGRSEHAHDTLRRFVSEGAELSEPEGGVDVVAQHDLASVDIPGKRVLDAFLDQPSRKAGSRQARACKVSLKLRMSGMIHSSCLRLELSPKRADTG